MKTCGENGPVKDLNNRISTQNPSCDSFLCSCVCLANFVYLICITIFNTISLCWPVVTETNKDMRNNTVILKSVWSTVYFLLERCSSYSLIFIVTFFGEAATSQGMTNGSSQTEENNHSAKRLEENPKNVHVICNNTQRRYLNRLMWQITGTVSYVLAYFAPIYFTWHWNHRLINDGADHQMNLSQ